MQAGVIGTIRILQSLKLMKEKYVAYIACEVFSSDYNSVIEMVVWHSVATVIKNKTIVCIKSNIVILDIICMVGR